MRRDFCIDALNRLAELIMKRAIRFITLWSDMVWLVVGDAETQRDRLTSLGLGSPIEIDREGNRLQ